MRRVNSNIFLLILIFIISSCSLITGEELGRISFDKPIGSDQEITPEIYDAGFKSTSINLKKGDKVSVWTDLDISFEGDLRMDYIVLVLNGNDTVCVVQALPFDVNVKVKSVETSFGNKHNMSYEGKMATLPPLPDDGEYVFSSVLRSSMNETIEFKKADLVIRK